MMIQGLLRRLSKRLWQMAAFGIVSLTLASPAVSCVPESKNIKAFCQDQPLLSRLLSVVWPDSAPYQIAVVAGVSRYPNLPVSNQLPPVEYDVDTLVKLLREKFGFDEVIVLTGTTFSPENIRYLFSQYIPSRLAEKKNTQVLFTFSGHGADYNDTGVLFLSDTRTIDPQNWSDLDRSIDLQELKVLMRPTIYEATHFLALLNSCKGGYFLEGGPASFGPTSVLDAKGAHGITAGGKRNNVYARPNIGSGKGSVFFEMLFAALNGSGVNLNGTLFPDPAADNGILSTVKLATFLNSTIEKIEDYKFGPQMGTLDPKKGDGYFFFVTNEERANAQLKKLYPKSWEKAFGSIPPSSEEQSVLKEKPSPPSSIPPDPEPTPRKAPPQDWRLVLNAMPNSTIYSRGQKGSIKITAAGGKVKAYAIFPMLPRERRKIEAFYSESEGGLYIPFQIPGNAEAGVWDVDVYIEDLNAKKQESHTIQFMVRQ
jgi:hypothetical protein